MTLIVILHQRHFDVTVGKVHVCTVISDFRGFRVLLLFMFQMEQIYYCYWLDQVFFLLR